MIGSQYFTVHWFVLQRNTWLVTPVDHRTLSYRKTQEFSSSSVSRVDQDVPSLALNPDSRPSQERERPYEQRRHDCNHLLSELSGLSFYQWLMPCLLFVWKQTWRVHQEQVNKFMWTELCVWFVYKVHI